MIHLTSIAARLRQLRGATALSYTLATGLIAIVAIGTVSSTGSSVKTLMGDVATSMTDVNGGAASSGTGGDQGPSGPASLALSASSGDATAMDVTGPGSPALGSPVSFSLVNSGAEASDSLTVTLADGSNFVITAEDCTGVLSGGGTCSISVTPQASAGGALSDTLQVAGNNNPTIALAGTASGFDPAALAPPEGGNPSGTGFSVTGPSTTESSCVDFTVSNGGDFETGSLSASFVSGGAHFSQSGCTDSCSGQTLAGGASCTIGVKFDPSANGTHNDTLRVDAGGGVTLDFPLAGTASSLNIAASVNSFSHSNGANTFSANWSGGEGYSSCSLQHCTGSSSCVTIQSVSCASGSSSYSLSSLGSSWGGRTVRMVDGSGTALVSLGTLSCGSTSGTSSPNNRDEDCDGSFDESTTSGSAYELIVPGNVFTDDEWQMCRDACGNPAATCCVRRNGTSTFTCTCPGTTTYY